MAPTATELPDEYEEYFAYLDTLRESGGTNMYGTGRYLMARFGLSRKVAQAVVLKWMETFESRHPSSEYT